MTSHKRNPFCVRTFRAESFTTLMLFFSSMMVTMYHPVQGFLPPRVLFPPLKGAMNTHDFRSRRPRSHGSAIVLQGSMYSGSSKNNNNNSNEGGVPLSSSLPPLGDSTKRPLPKVLPNGGRVTLLGSGPGDPDLLTVAAYRLLTQEKENTVVVVDRLVSQEILDLIASPVVKVARKLPGCADLAQEEIYWWCYKALNQGKHVIRLKIGDPYVFGRGGEEVLKFRKFGVEPTVIPGVSAAFSAPLLGNIPVTHRGVSNQVVMCTGYGRDASSPDLIRYHKEQTIVFLMAVGRLAELSERLQRMAGYPADTPVAIVERAGCPNQRTVVGDMTTIADLAIKYNVKPPSTIVVGDVVRVLLEDDCVYAGGMGQHISGLVQNFTATYP